MPKIRLLITGAINGANLVYTLPAICKGINNSVTVTLNGLLLTEPTHYALVDNVLTMVNPPQVGDSLAAMW